MEPRKSRKTRTFRWLFKRLTSQVNQSSGDPYLAVSDFVLFVIFVVYFNCGIWDNSFKLETIDSGLFSTKHAGLAWFDWE